MISEVKFYSESDADVRKIHKIYVHGLYRAFMWQESEKKPFFFFVF